MSSPHLLQKFDRMARAANQRFFFENMLGAYDAYSSEPASRALQFGALRALVRLCRFHDLEPRHVLLFAELGRVDDEAPAQWQLVLQRRKPTRPHRERDSRDRALRNRTRTDSRRWRRFIAVMDRLDHGGSLKDAWAAVAQSEPNVTAETIGADYHVIAKQYRSAGLDAIEVGNDDAVRTIALPRPGRPQKKV